MSKNQDNRRRTFAEVVTIEAWHEGFSPDSSKVDLHVDVVFGTARIGGEEESPVRFRMSVKRADVVVVIPESEPVIVERSSVSRDAPQIQGKITETLEKTSAGKIKGNVDGSISLAGMSGTVTAAAQAEAAISTSNKVETTATIQLIVVTQSKTAEGNYRWSLQPSRGNILEGRPWDAELKPRLKLIDQRKNRGKGIPPSVRVEIRCLREDLEITDIEMKNENYWEAAKNNVGFKKKMAAAEAYIRDRLVKEGLEIKNIRDPFGDLTLGSATAGP